MAARSPLRRGGKCVGRFVNPGCKDRRVRWWRVLTLALADLFHGWISGDGHRKRALTASNTQLISHVEPLEARRLLANTLPTVTLPGEPLMVQENQVLDVVPAITLADPDSTTLLATLSVSHGTLTLGMVTGLTFLNATDNGEATITVLGTTTDLNTAFATLEYQGDPGYTGPDTLAATASDLTYKYRGGTLSGNSPYNGGRIQGEVTMVGAQLAPLAGSGGSLTGSGAFVQSYAFSVIGLAYGPSNALFRNFQFTFDGNLTMTQGRVAVEANHRRGASNLRELMYIRGTSNYRDVAGDDDTYPNRTDFFLMGPFAHSNPSTGTWWRVQTAQVTVGIAVTQAPTTWQVSRLVGTPSGFVTQFTGPLDPSELSLYDVQAGLFGSPDVTLVRSAGDPLAGSLVAGTDSITFIATGGPLPAGDYTVNLRSASDGFKSSDGELLDGNFDGSPGTDYVGHFSVSAAQPVVVSLADFARGPSQEVHVPPLEKPGSGGTGGLPITLSQAAGVETVVFSLTYDPAQLTITGAVPGPDSAQGGAIVFDDLGSGEISVRYSSGSPLIAGQADLIRLMAEVPASAAYGAAHVLDVIGVTVNDGAISATADDAVHVAAYLGETTGNQEYSGLDAQRAARLGVGLDNGFEAYPVIDPVLIADVTRNGDVSGLDAQRIAQEAVRLDPWEIPPIPQPQRLDGMHAYGRTANSRQEPFVAAEAASAESSEPGVLLVLRDAALETMDVSGDLLRTTLGQDVQIAFDAFGFGWFNEKCEVSGTNEEVRLVSPQPGFQIPRSVDHLAILMRELGDVFRQVREDEGVMYGTSSSAEHRELDEALQQLTDGLSESGAPLSNARKDASLIDKAFARLR